LDNLSKSIEQDLTKSGVVEVSDWVKSALEKARELISYPHEKTLANELIQQAFQAAANKGCPVGMSLAAAFDLFVAAEYYKSVAHKGWYYCPAGEPALFYPFTNTCPRCLLKGEFYYEMANKPGSGLIGQATARLLSVFLEQLFIRAGRRLRIYRGVEPIDMLIFDELQNIVLLSEIKAAPLTTLALVVRSEKLTDSVEGETVDVDAHTRSDNPFLSLSEIYMLLPTKQYGNHRYRLISLGTKDVPSDKTWAYRSIEHALQNDPAFFHEYLDFWMVAFDAYKLSNRTDSTYFWFTNACGQPNPRPSQWPRRRLGEGYESVSDAKTSVGMDRTDDIKKGIYQVLKIGAESKPNKSAFAVRTALISNIHAVRHYHEYLATLEDIVWTLDRGRKARKVEDLPAKSDVYSLFDGIISFTESSIRDEWIEENFSFSL
jgi:hypothetical protein